MGRQKIVIILTAILFVSFLGIQFIPVSLNQGRTVKGRDITAVYSMPVNVQSVLKRSCYDCHSNRTDYPWYAHLQPIRYLMDRHVAQGKDELNFNEFASYTARKKVHRLEAIATSLKEGSMPLSSYLIMHQDAQLSAADTAKVLAWIRSVNARN